MRRVALNFLRTSTGLLLPTLFLTACPGDDTSQTSSDTEGTSETSDSDSDDPTTNSNTDPDTSTTEDPDTSSTMTTTTMTTDPTEESSSTDPTDPTEESSSTDPTEESSSTDPSESSSSGMPELCGNGDIDVGEDCDGANLGGADCVGQDFDAGELACDACAFDTTACINFACGNDAIEGKEICDGTDLGGADCVSEGFPLGGELGCTDNCGDYDTTACLLYVCGDAAIDDVEVCDGDNLPQSCTDLEFDGGEVACNADCLGYDTSGCSECGNGILEGDEVCDGDDFGAATCGTLGFDSGTPTCAADCGGFSTDSCYGVHTYCVNPNAAIADGIGFTGDVNGAPTLANIVVSNLAGQVADVDVVLDVTHTWISDLDITVSNVDAAQTTDVITDACVDGNNVDATFDEDSVVLPQCAGTPNISGTVNPDGDFNIFTGDFTSPNATWRLTASDDTQTDTGTLNEFCVEITTEAAPEFNYVFVTSTMVTGNMGGLDGADAICQARADAAGLPGTYYAWLSTANSSPSTRFNQSTDPYRLVDGTLVANNWTDLTDNALLAAINMTELGGPVPVGNTSCAGGGFPTAWTATNANGTLAFAQNTCSDWTSEAGGAIWGLASDTGALWSNWCSGGLCSWISPIYCVEQ